MYFTVCYPHTTFWSHWRMNYFKCFYVRWLTRGYNMYATIRCIPLVVSTSRSFPQSCLISGFVTWVTRRGCHIWIVPHILMYLLQKLWTLSPQRTMATPGVESYYNGICPHQMYLSFLWLSSRHKGLCLWRLFSKAHIYFWSVSTDSSSLLEIPHIY
jgi:hypothetical protein